MVRTPLLILTTLFAIGCASSPSSPSRDEDSAFLYSRMGLGHFNKGDYNRALGQYLEAQKADPRNESIQNQLGLTYFMLKQPQKSLEHFDRALQLRPDFAEAKNNKARVLIEIRAYSEAQLLLQEVLSDLTYPHGHKARMNLGLLEFERGRFERARDLFLESLKVDRENCQLYNYYGRSLYELGEHQSATSVFDRAIELCKSRNHPEPLYFSAMNLYKAGDLTRARARFTEVMELFPLEEYARNSKTMLELLDRR